MTKGPHFPILLLLLGAMALGESQFISIAKADNEVPKEMLAAQIRNQRMVCDQPQRAVRDAKRSRPDYDVWTLTCKNAVYRIGRYPDLAARVVRLR